MLNLLLKLFKVVYRDNLRTACRNLFLAICIGVGLQAVRPGWCQTRKENASSLDRWKPVVGAANRAEYTGPQVCAQCHPSQAEGQLASPMGRAASPPAEDKILRESPLLQFRLGPYEYQIARRGDRSIYWVSNGDRTISAPILYAFGLGVAGQTYLFEHEGAYYESRVSYFLETKALDITFGHPSSVPWSLEDALGNRLDADQVRACFSCHNTAAFTSGRADPGNLIPGVTCEACHGPGAKHVTAMKTGQSRQTFVFNPARLEPGELTDFCGACHRTFLDVVSLKIHGIRNVRFQPYRLVGSRCWNAADARIQCVSCHDPHERMVKGAALYDAKCLACHGVGMSAKPSRNQPGPACPVEKRQCVNCHMPKLTLPGAHSQFTDHQIRVARPGEDYPD